MNPPHATLRMVHSRVQCFATIYLCEENTEELAKHFSPHQIYSKHFCKQRRRWIFKARKSPQCGICGPNCNMNSIGANGACIRNLPTDQVSKKKYSSIWMLRCIEDYTSKYRAEWLAAPAPRTYTCQLVCSCPSVLLNAVSKSRIPLNGNFVLLLFPLCIFGTYDTPARKCPLRKRRRKSTTELRKSKHANK